MAEHRAAPDNRPGLLIIAGVVGLAVVSTVGVLVYMVCAG